MQQTLQARQDRRAVLLLDLLLDLPPAPSLPSAEVACTHSLTHSPTHSINPSTNL